MSVVYTTAATAEEFRDEVVAGLHAAAARERDSTWAKYGTKADQERCNIRAKAFEEHAAFLKSVQFHKRKRGT